MAVRASTSDDTVQLRTIDIKRWFSEASAADDGGVYAELVA